MVSANFKHVYVANVHILHLENLSATYGTDLMQRRTRT